VQMSVRNGIKAAGINRASHKIGKRPTFNAQPAFGKPSARQASNVQIGCSVAVLMLLQNQTLTPNLTHESAVAESRQSGDIIAVFMTEPSPYKSIAVASTFSPRFVQVLAEAKRMRDRFRCDLHVIYVGDRSEETARKFHDVFTQ